MPVGKFAVGSQFSVITISLMTGTITFEMLNEELDDDDPVVVGQYRLKIGFGAPVPLIDAQSV